MTDTPTVTPLANPQDPLPESNWFWRRVFVFAVTAVVMFFVWGLVDRVGKVAIVEPHRGIPALVVITKWVIALAGIVITYYLLAPSAEQITKLVKTASLLKAGVQVASQAIIRREGGQETRQVMGIPPEGTPTPPKAPDAPHAPESGPLPHISEADADAMRPPVGSYFGKGEHP